MKKIASLALAALALTSASAQENTPKLSVLSDIKFSGYVMSQYQYTGQDSKESNSFNIRMVRMALDGRLMKDFYWKVQLQANGNTSDLGSSPRMVDAFAEWQKYEAFKIKAGQFKRPFTFENPMHPITQGFMGYSQNVSKLAGFSDRAGEHASNGRDIGVQIQGDLIKTQPDATSCIIRWACSTDRAPTTRTLTSARTSSVASGCHPLRDCASVRSDGQVRQPAREHGT